MSISAKFVESIALLHRCVNEITGEHSDELYDLAILRDINVSRIIFRNEATSMCRTRICRLKTISLTVRSTSIVLQHATVTKERSHLTDACWISVAIRPKSA